MPNFRYTALNRDGRTVRGMAMADNELDLESRLEPLSLELLTAKETKEKKGSKYGKVKIKDMIVMCLHCLLYTSPSPRDRQKSRMPSSA